MPALVLRHPIVRDVVRARGVELRRVEVERQQHAHGWIGRIRGVGLAEGGTLLGEAAHAAAAAAVLSISRRVSVREDMEPPYDPVRNQSPKNTRAPDGPAGAATLFCC